MVQLTQWDKAVYHSFRLVWSLYCRVIRKPLKITWVIAVVQVGCVISWRGKERGQFPVELLCCWPLCLNHTYAGTHTVVCKLGSLQSNKRRACTCMGDYFSPSRVDQMELIALEKKKRLSKCSFLVLYPSECRSCSSDKWWHLQLPVWDKSLKMLHYVGGQGHWSAVIRSTEVWHFWVKEHAGHLSQCMDPLETQS